MIALSSLALSDLMRASISANSILSLNLDMSAGGGAMKCEPANAKPSKKNIDWTFIFKRKKRSLKLCEYMKRDWFHHPLLFQPLFRIPRFDGVDTYMIAIHFINFYVPR